MMSGLPSRKTSTSSAIRKDPISGLDVSDCETEGRIRVLLYVH